MRHSPHNDTASAPVPVPEPMATLLASTAHAATGPPGLDLDHHPNGHVAHIALRDLVFEDPALTIAHLREDPRAVLGTAWRRAQERWPMTSAHGSGPPLDCAVTAFEGGRLRGAIVALPHSPCPAAADFVLAARPKRATSRVQTPLYVVSERIIAPSGELTSRLGRWYADGLYERIGPGVPWAPLVFQEAVLDAMRGRPLSLA